MALRSGDDREIWNKINDKKSRIGQAATGRSGLFDLRENTDPYSRNNETAPGWGASEEETSSEIRNIQEYKKDQERPYRERHRVEVGGQRKKDTQKNAGELKEWFFPESTFQKSDAHRQSRTIRGNVPGNRRNPFPEKTDGTARTEPHVSSDLLFSKSPKENTGRQSAQYGSGTRDKLSRFGSDLRNQPGTDPGRSFSERKASAGGIADRRTPVRGTPDRKTPARGTSDRNAYIHSIPERKTPERGIPKRETPGYGRSERGYPDRKKSGRDISGYRDIQRDLSNQSYPELEETTDEREISSVSRRRKREQARKERERQIRKFYLIAGSGIFLIIVLAVFVLVSLFRGGDKNGTVASEQKTEASASGQDENGSDTETEDRQNSDVQTPDTESADAENAGQEEILTEPGDSSGNTEGKPADSGQEDAVGNSKEEQSPEESSADTVQGTDGAQKKYTNQDDWRLLIVNPWNKIPEGYSVQTKSLINGESVDSRCYDELVSMLEACRAGNGAPIVCSSYRPHEKQVMLYENQVSSLMSQGMSREDALKEAGTVVAVPGTSEHELGLAVDICDTYNQLLDESQAETWTQKWLMEHCWEYGFILRYPPEKTEFTGIIYEPWHYRYVGKEAAAEIHQQNICLEEYLSP